MIINIQDDILKIHALGLLNPLLIDRTSEANIIWATDAYEYRGRGYERTEQITAELITGENSDIIKTRARKAMEHQALRTKQRAEVFTPLWVCNMMNNHADEVWFGRPDVFNKDNIPTNKVIFPENKTWKEYVSSTRLEITCGEAPYLVSRYDVSTGEMMPVANRIGLLDRKLRVVSENAANKESWMRWAANAVKSIYGYEFQGDNLLIARVNVLMTYEEHFVERWNQKLSPEEYGKIIDIITWNIWQMDGLTGTLPYSLMEHDQMDLFGEMDATGVSEDDIVNPPCIIFDWQKKQSIPFEALKGVRA